MNKIKSFGKCYKLFAVAVAIMLLGLMVPHGVNAVAADNTTNGKAAKEVNDAFWHHAKLYVDNDPNTRPEGFLSWDVLVLCDGVKDPKYSAEGITAKEFAIDEEIIPDGAKVGIDSQYRLHETHVDPLNRTWDIFVTANENPGFEAFAWYIDLPGGGYHGLLDNIDATDEGAYEITKSVFGESEISFCCEFIGTVDVDLKTTEGHNHYNWKYYVDGKLKNDEPAFPEEEWYYWEDTQLSIDKDSNLISTFTDPIIGYTETEQLTAVPKDGYKLVSWTIDGKEYKVGEAVDVMTVQYQQAPFSIQANYKAMTIAQTGDNQALPFIIIGLVVVALACGGYAIYRFVIKKK